MACYGKEVFKRLLLYFFYPPVNIFRIILNWYIIIFKINMSKVATDFMERHKWSSETPLSELAKYTEEISKSLKDRKARFHARAHFRQLGLSKEQAEVLVPIQPSGKYEEGRDPIDKIAQEIIDNDYSSEKIKEIAYGLVSSAPNPVAGSSRFTLL